MGRWWRRSRRSSLTCLPRGDRRRRFAPMGWTCCGGFVSAGPAESTGTGQIGPRRESSRSCCRRRPNHSARIGAMGPGPGGQFPARSPRASIRLPCERIARRCCAASTTFTVTPAVVLCSTRSRSIARVAADGRMRTTIRWNRFATSVSASTDRGFQLVCQERSPTRSSTRSSPGCRRIGTGRWSPSTCLRGRGRRSCCRLPAHASIRDGR